MGHPGGYLENDEIGSSLYVGSLWGFDPGTNSQKDLANDSLNLNEEDEEHKCQVNGDEQKLVELELTN